MRKVEAAVAGASYGKGAYSIWAKRQSSHQARRGSRPEPLFEITGK